MSGWIKMSVDLRDHPKVIRIVSALKADRLRVVGGLWAVWSVFDTHSVDGALDGYTLDAMDEVLGWKGFSKAMAGIGWLAESEDGLRAPDYEEHNGPSAKRRAVDAKRKECGRDADKGAYSSWNNVGQMSASKADKTPTETGQDVDRKATRVELDKSKKEIESASPRKKPLPTDFGISDRVRSWASEKGHGHLQDQLEALVSHAKRNGAKYADWDEALMNAIRNDWAKVGKANGAAGDIFEGNL